MTRKQAEGWLEALRAEWLRGRHLPHGDTGNRHYYGINIDGDGGHGAPSVAHA